jgi:hypothetical protein
MVAFFPIIEYAIKNSAKIKPIVSNVNNKTNSLEDNIFEISFLKFFKKREIINVIMLKKKELIAKEVKGEIFW